jgi:hypothetical protein
MGKKHSKKQKIYKMVGCSKKTRKNHLGGSIDAPLAYTGKPIHTFPNPFLAYSGKGGSSCGTTINTNIPVNTNASNPAYPNTGPVSNGSNIIFNNATQQHGGSCSTCSSLMKGGSCSLCKMGFMVGGKRHRKDCKCSLCKKKILKKKIIKGGNPGIPYPNGLVGSPWTPSISGWPGVDGIPGDRNYYALNTYKNDPQTSMVDVGANPPFLNIKGGKKKQKGGVLSNFLGQDLINLGRQFQFGVGSAYNALAGYPAPTNPLPWKGQFSNNAINPMAV